MIMFQIMMMMMMMGIPQNIGKPHHFLILLDLIEQNGKMTFCRFKDYSMFFELLVFFYVNNTFRVLYSLMVS